MEQWDVADMGIANERILYENGAEERKALAAEVVEMPEGPGEMQDIAHGQKSRLWDWWLWAIAGIMLSLGITITIIVVLAMYDGQPLPNWPYSITLNAMTSVLTTIAKVSPRMSLKSECFN